MTLPMNPVQKGVLPYAPTMQAPAGAYGNTPISLEVENLVTRLRDGARIVLRVQHTGRFGQTGRNVA
jgi:hypothetical protein